MSHGTVTDPYDVSFGHSTYVTHRQTDKQRRPCRTVTATESVTIRCRLWSQQRWRLRRRLLRQWRRWLRQCRLLPLHSLNNKIKQQAYVGWTGAKCVERDAIFSWRTQRNDCDCTCSGSDDNEKNIECNNDDNNDGTTMLAATLTTLPVATSAFATTTITRSIALATTWMILMMMTSMRDDCTCDNTTVTVNTTVTMWHRLCLQR